MFFTLLSRLRSAISSIGFSEAVSAMGPVFCGEAKFSEPTQRKAASLNIMVNKLFE